MRRFLTISFVFLYALSFTEFHQLLKLPLLVEHYAEHKGKASGITFIEFLVMHYETDVAHDETDNSLPFKGCDHSIFSQITFLPAHKFTLGEFVPDTQETYSTFYQKFCPVLQLGEDLPATQGLTNPPPTPIGFGNYKNKSPTEQCFACTITCVLIRGVCSQLFCFMLDKVIRFSIENKLIIGLITGVLILWGSYSITQLPIDALPDITNNQVQVITISPSNGAEDVERLITFPVEQTMSTIPGLEEIRSLSRFGLSIVTIVFNDNIDVYWARQQVNERLSHVRSLLPAGIGIPELAPLTTGLGEIFQYTIRAKPGYEDQFSIMEMRTIQDWIVRRQLLGVEGVADVSSFGGHVKQYEVALTSDRLRSLNISIVDVMAALEKNNQNTGGAYIDQNASAYYIRSEGLIKGTEDINNIVVKSNPSGVPLLMRDAGNVGFGSAARYGAMTHNTDGEVAGAIVLMLKGANSSEVIRNVKERILQIEKTLPEGIVIEPFLDRTKLVDNAISTVSTNLAEGALIVIFVLVLMLGNLRAGLIVASVIPLAMLFAVSMMNLFGVSGNLMSLGAIDFGLIVDGAVIIVEATMHHLGLRTIRGQLTQSEMDAEVHQSASRIRTSAAFGEMIILIVYLPILTLVGVEGKMFRPMAQTVAFAIAGAFILSLTYVPMMSAQFLSKNPTSKQNVSDRIMRFFHRIYDPAISYSLKRKQLVITLSAIAFAGSLFVFTRLGAEFIPTLEEGDFAVETLLLKGSSLSETIDIASQSSKVLMENFPEVQEVVGKIGTAEIPVDPMPMESCDLIVVLKDHAQWTSASSREELAGKMQKKLNDNIAGVSFSFQQPIQMRFNELATGARQDVVIKIYGEDTQALVRYATQVGEIAGKIDGAEDIYVERAEGLPQLVVEMNRPKLAQFGVSVDEVNRVIRASFAGETVGMVFEGEKRFDLVVRLDKKNRSTVDDLNNIFITSSRGQPVPLSQLATIGIRSGTNQIQRDDAKRRILVGFNVRGRDVQSIVDEIEQKINKEISFEPGYRVTYGGTFENLQKARARLAIAVPAALTLIFLLLYFTFSSLRQSFLILTSIPFSAIGGIIALWLRGMPFSISAGIGFIALSGVAVLNGIVLIAEFNHLKKEGLTDADKIVKRGTSVRLRPVIMTALVASLGFLPMALSTGSGAEVQKPLATVVIGGLISSTILTLLVLPCLYFYFEKGIKMKASVVCVILCLSLPLLAPAQSQVIGVDRAVELALANNKSVEAARLGVEMNEALKKTSGDIGKTFVQGMVGQYNGYPKNDNNVTISQSIPFPTVISARSALGNSKITSSKLLLATAENQLAFEVKSTWYHLNYLKNLGKRLRQQDSLFNLYSKAAAARSTAGEGTLLEKITAEGKYMRVRTQLKQNEADVLIYQQKLQSLLFAHEEVDATDELAVRHFSLADTGSVSNPRLLWYKQQIDIAHKEKSLQRNLGLPDFSIGYFNQTLIGVPLESGAVATRTNRFQGVMVGLSIPLWIHPQIQKVKAAALTLRIDESEYQQQKKNNSTELRVLTQELSKYRESLNFYQSNIVPQADLILNQATKAFKAGETGSLEYLQALNTAAELQQGYLETINNYNQAVLRLELLINHR